MTFNPETRVRDLPPSNTQGRLPAFLILRPFVKVRQEETWRTIDRNSFLIIIKYSFFFLFFDSCTCNFDGPYIKMRTKIQPFKYQNAIHTEDKRFYYEL